MSKKEDLIELITILEDSLLKNPGEWVACEFRLTHQKTGVYLWMPSGRMFFSIFNPNKDRWREQVKVPYFKGGRLWKLAYKIWKGIRSDIAAQQINNILSTFKNKK